MEILLYTEEAKDSLMNKYIIKIIEEENYQSENDDLYKTFYKYFENTNCGRYILYGGNIPRVVTEEDVIVCFLFILYSLPNIENKHRNVYKILEDKKIILRIIQLYEKNHNVDFNKLFEIKILDKQETLFDMFENNLKYLLNIYILVDIPKTIDKLNINQIRNMLMIIEIMLGKSKKTKEEHIIKLNSKKYKRLYFLLFAVISVGEIFPSFKEEKINYVLFFLKKVLDEEKNNKKINENSFIYNLAMPKNKPFLRLLIRLACEDYLIFSLLLRVYLTMFFLDFHHEYSIFDKLNTCLFINTRKEKILKEIEEYFFQSLSPSYEFKNYSYCNPFKSFESLTKRFTFNFAKSDFAIKSLKCYEMLKDSCNEITGFFSSILLGRGVDGYDLKRRASLFAEDSLFENILLVNEKKNNSLFEVIYISLLIAMSKEEDEHNLAKIIKKETPSLLLNKFLETLEKSNFEIKLPWELFGHEEISKEVVIDNLSMILYQPGSFLYRQAEENFYSLGVKYNIKKEIEDNYKEDYKFPPEKKITSPLDSLSSKSLDKVSSFEKKESNKKVSYEKVYFEKNDLPICYDYFIPSNSKKNFRFFSLKVKPSEGSSWTFYALAEEKDKVVMEKLAKNIELLCEKVNSYLTGVIELENLKTFHQPFKDYNLSLVYELGFRGEKNTFSTGNFTVKEIVPGKFILFSENIDEEEVKNMQEEIYDLSNFCEEFLYYKNERKIPLAVLFVEF